MPSINVSFGPAGPLLQVLVGLSRPHRDVLAAANQPVPPFVQGTFLVDTGASNTVVDPGLVQPLGLTPTGAVTIQTPSTAGAPHSCYQYDVMLFIPNGIATDGSLIVDALPVIETHLRPQGIDGLIGRDVLQRCVLIANGSIGLLTLAY